MAHPMEDRARNLDRDDPLSSFRDRFVFHHDCIYLDGNSLGRLPIETPDRIRTVVEEEWAGDLVVGWESWLGLGTEIGDRLAPLIGAGRGEVAVCDQTSVNLFKLASAALGMNGRTDILTDAGNFPSDRYILESVASAAGGRLILVREDPSVLDIEHAIEDSVGLVSLSHVAYRSGSVADAANITRVAHDHGALMLWDLAHSVGCVAVHLEDWNADLAVGCTYKYLNAGPGAPGFLYVRSDLQTKLDQPITGWFGHADQFSFDDQWRPADDIRRFLVGTPPVLSIIGVDVGVALTLEAGIERLRHKSVALTSLFIEAVAPLLQYGLKIITPLDPDQRGSHVTTAHEHGFQIATALRERNVIPDFRTPDLIRFGFAPLYTTFSETVAAAEILAEILKTRGYEEYPATRRGVT